MSSQTTVDQQETRQPVYLIVFVVLAIFTALEVGTTYLPSLPQVVKIGLLVFLAAVKVGLVLLYFMHLRYDNRMFAMPIALALVLIVPLLSIVSITTQPTNPSSTSVANANHSQTQTKTLNVIEDSYSIKLSQDSIQSGSVTFHVKNQASQITHQLLIIRTDKAPDQLPTDNKGNVDQSSVDIVGKAVGIQPGSSKDVTVDLKKGQYVLICNLPGHYSQGMRVALTVGSRQSSSQTPQVSNTPIPASVSGTSTSSSTQTVTVTEDTFSINLDPNNIPAGSVTFEIKNNAEKLPHQLMVIRTDKSADALPTDKNGDLIESQLDIVGSVDRIPHGESQSLTLKLDAGHYALVCNIPNHYHEGMYADLTVK